MMTQTLAILLDAYRELNAKKMFWIVLILNALAMLAFAVLGANDHAITILWFEPFGDARGGGNAAMYLYKDILSIAVVGIWFTWLSTGLALASTASIFPDFVASGSVDLYLSRPVGRLRLFLTKYLAGLLFVLLQVTLFTTMSFLILGTRAGLWEPGIFWAIPILLVFFSYLYGIQVLIGTWTRSTVAALLIAFTAWGAIWGVDSGERFIKFLRHQVEIRQAMMDDEIADLDRQIALNQGAAASAPGVEAPAAGTAPRVATMGADDGLETLKARRDQLVTQRADLVVPPSLITAENVAFGIKSFVPKTRETTNLLDRVLFKDSELQQMMTQNQQDATAAQPPNGPFPRQRAGANVVQVRARQELEARERPVWWIVGTSLLFEAACLALAAWIFCTRDF